MELKYAELKEIVLNYRVRQRHGSLIQIIIEHTNCVPDDTIFHSNILGIEFFHTSTSKWDLAVCNVIMDPYNWRYNGICFLKVWPFRATREVYTSPWGVSVRLFPPLGTWKCEHFILESFQLPKFTPWAAWGMAGLEESEESETISRCCVIYSLWCAGFLSTFC